MIGVKLLNCDILNVGDLFKKIKLPTSPKIRRDFFLFIDEIEKEKEILTKLKASYENEELMSIEKEKYEFVKKFETTTGINIYGLTIDSSRFVEIKAFIDKQNENETYKQYSEFLEFLNHEFFPKSPLINIDDLPDDVFENLTDGEIEQLMKFLK